MVLDTLSIHPSFTLQQLPNLPPKNQAETSSVHPPFLKILIHPSFIPVSLAASENERVESASTTIAQVRKSINNPVKQRLPAVIIIRDQRATINRCSLKIPVRPRPVSASLPSRRPRQPEINIPWLIGRFGEWLAHDGTGLSNLLGRILESLGPTCTNLRLA